MLYEVITGTVGAAFPIVMSLIGPDPSLAMVASTTVIAYAFGHAGQLLSPVHVCLLVSNEYFNVGLARSLKGLLKPTAIILFAGFILSRLYMAILYRITSYNVCYTKLLRFRTAFFTVIRH